MKLTILTFSYFPETTALAKRATETAQFLSRQGVDVTVVTQAPNYPQGRIYDGYGDERVDIRTEGGVRVIRLRPWLVDLSNLPLRLAVESYFALRCWWWGRKLQADVVFATSPYMFLGPAGLLAARKGKRPFVWEVRDLTWRYPAAAGKKTFGMDKLLEALMLWTGRRASALVTTTQGQLDYFRDRNSAPRHRRVVPNGVSREYVEKIDAQPASGSETDEKRVVYAGLLGFAQGLASVVAAAMYLPDTVFYLVGDGAQREGLEQMIKEQEIPNVRFTGYVGSDEVLDFYRSAAVLVAHLRRDPVFEVTQPSKVWEYMATGKPVVYGGAGEAARAIEESGGGVVVAPDDPRAMADAIRHLLDHPEEAAEIGRKGRSYVLSSKRRETILEDFVAFLASLASTNHV